MSLGAAARILVAGGPALMVLGATCAGGAGSPDDDALARRLMVENQIVARGVRDASVLDAMRKVPRHRFVPEAQRAFAHDDGPLPIGEGQTISQPYIVALMTELAAVDRTSKVLEIGTGSGYQAAVLAEIAGSVFTIEIVPELGKRSAALLEQLGYANVKAKIGDGYDGWPDEAPFDAIVVTAAPGKVPQPLLDQLKIGGRLVIPVGVGYQELLVITRTETGYDRRSTIPVRFVPMTGKARG
jgi:protein-L-isoaspartate(D-aspartate) O-methyltransferase